jgi:hypothetical protein
VFEVTLRGSVYAASVGLIAGSVASDRKSLDTWFPEHSIRLEYDGSVRGKGMFGDPSVENGVDVAMPAAVERELEDGVVVTVVLDLLCRQVGWLINGRLCGVKRDLPLGHHEAHDLRFMVSTRNSTWLVTGPGQVSVSGVDWAKWTEGASLKGWRSLKTPAGGWPWEGPGKSFPPFPEAEVRFDQIAVRMSLHLWTRLHFGVGKQKTTKRHLDAGL